MKTIKLKSSYLLSTALFLSLVVTSCDMNEIPTSFVEPNDNLSRSNRVRPP